MAAAMARRMNKNYSSQREVAKAGQISQGYIMMADVVLDHAPDDAKLVLSGAKDARYIAA